MNQVSAGLDNLVQPASDLFHHMLLSQLSQGDAECVIQRLVLGLVAGLTYALLDVTHSHGPICSAKHTVRKIFPRTGTLLPSRRRLTGRAMNNADVGLRDKD